jgi:Family of unknown function (DUF6994)
MGVGEAIDITFDFRSDTPSGRDPDALSPTLRRYHQRLWSKPLPSGAPFELDVTTPHTYLHHLSELGEFFLASDAVIPTFSRELRLAPIIDQIPEVEREAFHRIGYTIGGMMIFPGNRVSRKMTINGARGFHPRIKDRFDLTLECIRRHYVDEPSPLSDTLARYADFFGQSICPSKAHATTGRFQGASTEVCSFFVSSGFKAGSPVVTGFAAMGGARLERATSCL